MEMMIQASYFLAAVLFIVGLKQMSSPVTARRGILWSGVGMILATLVTFLDPTLHGVFNYLLMALGIAIGGGYAWQKGKTVPMVDMPQMIALFNGMGGGAAGAIAAVVLMRAIGQADAIPGGSVSMVLGTDVAIVALVGAFIGTISFSGSLIAWAKLDGRFKRTSLVPQQHWVNLALLVLVIYIGVKLFDTQSAGLVMLFFALVLLLGVFVTTPVGGADMPVAISLFNALTGLAVGLEGYVLDNAAMIIAGTVVGSAGTLLTQMMAKAMNRSVWNVLFGGFGQSAESADPDVIQGSMKEIQSQDTAIMMAYASQVVIVPGYGMAVAQAQHKVWELCELLEEEGVKVKFAIHPVAGRMPGHMNVLLAEAGVPYDKIFDMDEINPEFPKTTVALVIGANDVVNPDARNDKTSPLYGMPVLDAALAENVVVVKRGKGTGFSGVENALFYQENTQLLYGDGQKIASELIQHLKKL